MDEDRTKGLVYVGMASVFWGVSRFFSKVGVLSLGPWRAALFRSMAFLPVVGIFVMVTGNTRIEFSKATIYASLAGVLTGTSILFSRLAFGVYEVSIVSPVLRLSVLVTVGLSTLMLGEDLTRRKIVGVGAATCALIFLSL